MTGLKFKRLLSVFLALCLLCALFPAGAQAASGKKLVALTFDDGPGPYTNRLLDALDSRGVKVTFFALGQQVRSYPEVVRRAYDAGHQIASHTYSHKSLTSLSTAALDREINNTIAALDDAIGCSNTYMIRPPYGNYNRTVLSRLGVPAIYWSVDPRDWAVKSASTVYSRVMNSVRDGSIVLLHDIHSHSVTAAIQIVDALTAQGYECVTVNELLRRRGITPQNGVIYYDAYPTGVQHDAPEKPELYAWLSHGAPMVHIAAEAGTEIYYTTDSAAPISTWTRYTGPFPARDGAVVKAFCAYDKNGGRSRTAAFTVSGLLSNAPELSVTDGVCTITPDGPNDIVYYTLDGKDPTTAGTVYTAPFAITPGTVVTACAVTGSYRPSVQTYLTYSAAGHVFRDVRPTDAYYTDIDAAYTAGLMDGVGHDRFLPDMATNRATFVTILYRLAGSPAVTDTPVYTDMSADTWYAAPVCWATANGIIDGFADGTFRGTAELTREQAAAILYRYARLTGADTSARAGAADFPDFDAVNGYAVDAVLWAAAKGYIQPPGGRLEPRGSISRAELARLSILAKDMSAQEKGVSRIERRLSLLERRLMPAEARFRTDRLPPVKPSGCRPR